MKEMLHLISVFFKEIKFVVNMSITANLAILVIYYGPSEFKNIYY